MTLSQERSLIPLPAADEGEQAVSGLVLAFPAPEALPTAIPEAEASLAALYGRFDDLVKIDKRGRGHRDDGKFLSQYELEQIAAHQNQIRDGLLDRQAQRARAQKLQSIWGAQYHARYGLTAPIRSLDDAVRDRPEEELQETYDWWQAEAAATAVSTYLRASSHESWSKRTARTLREWWYDQDTVDKGSIVAIAVAASALVALLTYSDDSAPARGPLHHLSSPASHAQAAPQPRDPLLTDPKIPFPGSTAPRTPGPTDIAIQIPHGLTLRQRPTADSIWHEVATLQAHGTHLTTAQTAVVTQRIERANGIRSEHQAEQLPVGFRAKLTRKVRKLIGTYLLRDSTSM